MERTIKEVAKITGLSTDTLRYYDKSGLICPKRGAQGYRYYSESDLLMLKNLVVMKYAHFSLKEMQSMEELINRQPDDDCSQLSRSLLQKKVNELYQMINNYQKIIGLIEDLLLLIESPEAYQRNQVKVGEYIDQIFTDIVSKKEEED